MAGYFFRNILKNISAYILADGENSRIGTEKGLLQINNSTILGKTILLLYKIFPRVKVVSTKQQLRSQFSKHQFLEDIYPNCGPLGGIHAALQDCPEAAFIVACDMPSLNREMIEEQLHKFEQTVPQALIPKHATGIEPLHAVYSKSCLAAVEEQLQKRNYSIRSFYQNIKAEYWQISGRKAACFFNINTQADYEEFIASR
jgi:molybdopterin-guanine dinucleotide biosynthesis protein A